MRNVYKTKSYYRMHFASTLVSNDIFATFHEYHSMLNLNTCHAEYLYMYVLHAFPVLSRKPRAFQLLACFFSIRVQNRVDPE